MAETAEFDFKALQPAEAEFPKQEGAGRKRLMEDNPFIEWVQESYSDGKGRAVTMPKSQVETACKLIRRAAADVGLGVRIATSLKGEALEKAANNKNITVHFLGKEKREYTPRKKKTATQDVPENPGSLN